MGVFIGRISLVEILAQSLPQKGQKTNFDPYPVRFDPYPRPVVRSFLGK